MVIISSASLYEIMNFRFLSSGLVDSYMEMVKTTSLTSRHTKG